MLNRLIHFGYTIKTHNRTETRDVMIDLDSLSDLLHGRGEAQEIWWDFRRVLQQAELDALGQEAAPF